MERLKRLYMYYYYLFYKQPLAYRASVSIDWATAEIISILERRRILRRCDVHKSAVFYAWFDVQNGAFYARSSKA